MIKFKIFFSFAQKNSSKYICLYRFSHKDFGKAPDQNYPQAYNSTLRTNFYLGTKSKIFMTKSVNEYDNFTNTILTSSGTKSYLDLTHGEGHFRHFYNLLKGLTSMSDSSLSKLFITGVSPVTMDDVTSGFNIGTNISLDGNINEFMGFTEDEVRSLLNYYHNANLLTLDVEFCIDLMKKWYNNYIFSRDADITLFNSDMILFFIQKSIMRKSIPEKLIDQNIKIDYKKLRYLVTIDNQLNGNFNRLKSITFDQEILSDIEDSFPASELTKQKNFISLLYYFGLLSIQGTNRGQYLLKIPNLTILNLMYEYIRSGFEDVNIFKIDIWELSNLITKMAYDGDWKSFFQFLSDMVIGNLFFNFYLIKLIRRQQ